MVLDAVVLQILVIEDGCKPSLHDQTLEWDSNQYPSNQKKKKNLI